jgi:beta-phosphoglucomutase-like phosphatase (HAD superfamily)
MIKAVIFDIDGTLIDSVDLHAAAWVEALRHFGIDVPYATMRHEIGKGGDQLLPLFVSSGRLEREGSEISEFRADLFKREYLSRIRPFPAVPALFRRIRGAGQTLALASSGKADEVENYSRIAGVTDLVDTTTSADDAEHSKPEPDIFVAALGKVAPIPAEQCVVIGDTPWDGIAAKRAGVAFIGVLSGGFPEGELREASAIAVYRDAEDLLANYETSPLGVR